MHLTLRDFVVMTLSALWFSYIIIYGIVFAPSMQTRLLVLCFVLIFSFLLWLSFNPYLKVLYALLMVWSGWSSSPILVAVAQYFNLPYISELLERIGAIPTEVHIVIGVLSFVVLVLHYLDRRKKAVQGFSIGGHASDPKPIELLIYTIEGFRNMYEDKDRVAAYLLFLLSLGSLTIFSLLFYLQRVLPIPEISDDVVIFSIAITSAVVAGEAARNYRQFFHPVLKIVISLLVFCFIGGIATACIFVIETFLLQEPRHTFNSFKLGQLVLCGWISWLAAQLGADIGAHKEIEEMLSNPKERGGIWEVLLVGDYARGTALLSAAIFIAFVLGILSELTVESRTASDAKEEITSQSF